MTAGTTLPVPVVLALILTRPAWSSGGELHVDGNLVTQEILK